MMKIYFVAIIQDSLFLWKRIYLTVYRKSGGYAKKEKGGKDYGAIAAILFAMIWYKSAKIALSEQIEKEFA